MRNAQCAPVIITTVITCYYINGQRVAQERDGVFTWIHADHLSSATRLTDAAGLEIHHLAYAAFGEAAENQGSGDNPKYTDTDKEHDTTGLYYYGARYYDPAIYRFITADTVYDVGPQGLNRYSYALNNPIIYRDPTGHLSYADEHDPQGWEDSRPAEEIPITIGENMAEEGKYVDVGDGLKAKTSDVENAPRVYPEGWPELRAAPTKSFLRTNPVSRYLGEVIMFGTNLIASGQWWTDCNLITGECYSEKEIFDVKIGVLIDIGLIAGTAKVDKLLDPSKTLNNVLNPKEIRYMQSSAKNITGEHTILGNIEALKAGTLKPTDLPTIRVWRDAQGKIWTLDHWRLIAFRKAGVKEIPVKWGSKDVVAKEMWKMTTTTDGLSIKLKLGGGKSITVE